jgi:hypothetical protein
MPRENSALSRALGQLLTAIQREETRAVGSADWLVTHAVLGRAERLYWAGKTRGLDTTLGRGSVGEYLGLAWISAHPRVLPAVQQIEGQLRDVAEQA